MLLLNLRELLDSCAGTQTVCNGCEGKTQQELLTAKSTTGFSTYIHCARPMVRKEHSVNTEEEDVQSLLMVMPQTHLNAHPGVDMLHL